MQLLRKSIALPFRGAAFINVAENHDDASEVALSVADRRATIVDRRRSSAFRNEDHMVGETNHCSRSLNPFGRTFHRLLGGLIHNLKDSREQLALRVLLRPACQLLRHRIHPHHARVRIRNDHGIADALQNPQRASFAFLQILGGLHFTRNILANDQDSLNSTASSQIGL